TLGDVILSSFGGCFLLSKIDPGTAFFTRLRFLRLSWNLRQLLIHVIERARNLFGHVIDLEVLHHLAELRQRAAIASRDRLAERDSLPDHLEVRTANPAILDVRLSFCTALWAIHSIRNVS